MILKLVFLVVLCGALFSSALGVVSVFHCDYVSLYNDLEESYTCTVSKLDTDDKTDSIDMTGSHLANKTDSDVTSMIIEGTKTTYIPSGLGFMNFELNAFQISNSTLKEIEKKNFLGMEKLTKLVLSDNQLTSLPNDVFHHLKKLEMINLGGNQLKELASLLFIGNLNLKGIILNRNQLTFLGSSLFKHLSDLFLVDLSDNVCVNKKFGGTRMIKEVKLGVAGCNVTTSAIEETKEIEEMLSQKVVALELNVEELKADVVNYKMEIVQMELKHKKEVEALQVQDVCLNSNVFNMTCEFDDSYSEYSCRSEDVEITSENMVVGSVLGRHSQRKSNADVNELMIESLNMSFMSKDLFKTFPNLETLKIESTSVKELNAGDFSGAEKLKSLSLTKSKIKSLDEDVFQGADKLELINLDSNLIREVGENTFRGLSTLRALSMKNNVLKKLHPDTFKDLVNLRALFLSSNQLKALHGKLLQTNVKLVKVSFDKNQISVIGEDLLTYSKGSLKQVDFSDNVCIDDNSKNTGLDNVNDDIKMKCKKVEVICQNVDTPSVNNE